jgi:ketosteroid isomerase-like protein
VSSNRSRADTLERALRVGVSGDVSMLDELVTDDVRVWTPRFSASSLAELVTELSQRDDVFADVELTTQALAVGGDYACVEWTAAMTHVGPLVLVEGTIEPTGSRVAVHGVTVAEFEGDRICALRQYWDESTLFDQLDIDRAD